MVIHALGEFTNLVRKSQRIAEVFKFEFLFQMMFLHHAPVGTQFGGKFRTGRCP